MAAITR